MFIVIAIKEILWGIVRFFLEFFRGLFITIKFRALAFDSKLQYKFPTHIRALIWIGIIGGVCIILFFLLGYLGDLLLSITRYSSAPAPEY